MKNFAKLISEQCKKKNMTQEELAVRLGITPQAISKWENSIGLPDVTMFPLLAETLGLSIEELFGMPKTKEREDQNVALPQFFEGLPLLAEQRGFLCYSNKMLKEISDSQVLFCDGSVAELQSGRVINRGIGEVRVIKLSDVCVDDVSGEIVSRTESLSPFSSLSVELSRKCEVKVIADQKGGPRMFVRGREKLLEKLEVQVADDTLTIRLESSNHNGSSDSSAYSIEIYVPFERGNQLRLVLNGTGTATVSPSFVDGQVSINGCGNVTVGDFDCFTGRISGSGDMVIGKIAKQTKLRIAGAGEIKATEMANPDVRVSGSGTIATEHTEGNVKIGIAGSGDVALGLVQIDCADFQISGSGDISMRGETAKLKLDVAGSGTLAGEALTVDRAELTIKGSGDISLMRIITESVEKLSRDATLSVGCRG